MSNEQKINWFAFYADLVKDAGWYVKLFDGNPSLAKYMREVDDWWLGEVRNGEKAWRKSRQQTRADISAFIAENKEFAKTARELYLDEKEITATGKDLARIKAEREGRGITDEMIERANEFPIEEVVEVDKSHYALCVAHDDTNPSMWCKNNFAHCFSCGYTSSVIGVYMKVNNCSFMEAVRKLNR